MKNSYQLRGVFSKVRVESTPLHGNVGPNPPSVCDRVNPAVVQLHIIRSQSYYQVITFHFLPDSLHVYQYLYSAQAKNGPRINAAGEEDG